MNEVILQRAAPVAGIVGFAGLAGCGFGLLLAPMQVAAAWWTAALFILGLPLGAVALLMIHALTGGDWGRALRPWLRTIAATLPVALAMMLPLLLALHPVFAWAHLPPEELPEKVQLKLAYLNVPFFLVRAASCAVAWLWLWSLAMSISSDETTSRYSARRGRWAAVGLVIYGLSVLMFSVDWMLALEPQFVSTVYGMIEASGQMSGALALATLLICLGLTGGVPEGGKKGVLITEDASNMLFGFVLGWVYLVYMQYLIVWAADLPDEIHWYVARSVNGWQIVTWVMVACHAVAVTAFLSRSLKRSRNAVAILAATVLVGHALDVVWRVRPAFADTSLRYAWIDVVAFAALGGLLLAAAGSPRLIDRLASRAPING